MHQVVVLGRRHQHAQHGQGKSEDRDAGTHDGERGSLLRQQELNLVQKSDAGELEVVVEQVLADNPNAVEDVTAGGKKSKKARGFLLGQVMQKTKGQANPKVVSEILSRKLG